MHSNVKPRFRVFPLLLSSLPISSLFFSYLSFPLLFSLFLYPFLPSLSLTALHCLHCIRGPVSELQKYLNLPPVLLLLSACFSEEVFMLAFYFSALNWYRHCEHIDERKSRDVALVAPHNGHHSVP